MDGSGGSRPVVGIAGMVGPASYAVWTDVRAALVPHAYVAHVERAGGLPVLLPPTLGRTDDDWATIAGRLDALILTGGPDVDPARYGEAPHPSLQPVLPDRDESELALVRAADRLGLPLLAICRGLQVVAVAAGGTLIQHLPDVVGHTEHSPGPSRYGVHDVTIDPGSRLHAILGDGVAVRTYHHQAAATHPGWTPVAWATDGIVEALERDGGPGAPFRLAVQWHPEVGDDNRLFAALVEAAAPAVTSVTSEESVALATDSSDVSV